MQRQYQVERFVGQAVKVCKIDLDDRTPALQVTGSSGSETPISKIDRRLYFDAFRPFTTQGVEHRGLVRKTWRNGLRWLALRWLLR